MAGRFVKLLHRYCFVVYTCKQNGVGGGEGKDYHVSSRTIYISFRSYSANGERLVQSPSCAYRCVVYVKKGEARNSLRLSLIYHSDT